MRVIIAGGRDIHDYNALLQAIHDCGMVITEVVSGMAPGVDTLGIRYAQEHNLPVAEFPADWDKHGRAAGPIRNRQMAEYGDALIALWDGESRGTKNMIDEAFKRRLLVYVHRV